MKNKTTSNNRTTFVVLLLMTVALAPVPAAADDVVSSGVQLTSFASFSSQRQPETTDFDAATVPAGSPTEVEAFVPAAGAVTFPRIGQTQAFASSSVAGNGVFGVGVNAVFAPPSLPPYRMVASGTFTDTLTNNSPLVVGMVADFFIPAPTIQFFGQVGNNFPAGADPLLDVEGSVSARVLTRLTRLDNSVVETVLFDYGMTALRNPATGRLGATLSQNAAGFTQFEEPGFFRFQLSEVNLFDFDLGNIGPGETLEIGYDFFAQGRTGFGETGFFAAIGDPFNLSTNGGRFNVRVIDSAANPVPEPATMFLLGTGLAGVGAAVRRKRRARR